MKKTYQLKNKERTLLEFNLEMVETEAFEKLSQSFKIRLTKITETDKNIFPKNMELTDEGIAQWIESRKVPKNRAFVEKILSVYDNDRNPMKYIDVSFGLSLNDSYWIVPKGSEYLWKDYNLYQNDFSKALELVAFVGHSRKIQGIITSPEFTTNGMLKKCWRREENGEIKLYKGSTERFANGGLEAYTEYYAAQVAEVFEIPHLDYDLKLFHQELVSTCPLFTSEDMGYVPVYYLLEEKYQNVTQLSDYANQYEIAKVLGIGFFEDLMFFDSIIYNTDRHLGNFGLLVDNNTGKILGPAPIFDHGLSLFSRGTKEDLRNLKVYSQQLVSAFGLSFDEQAEFYYRPRHRKYLHRLREFAFKRHDQYNLPEEHLQAVERFLNKRALELLNR